MNAPRPGDAYWLDVAYTDGNTIRYTIDALDFKSAAYEAAYILGGRGDRHTPIGAVKGVLFHVSGDVAARGDRAYFEGLS